MAIQLYKQEGWVDTIKGLEPFGIVPEIRAQGTISKGVTDAPAKSGGTKAEPRDHFIVHFEPECRVKTKTDPRLLSLYCVMQEELKTLHVSIPSPALSFKTGRFKHGKKSGVLCSSDDNITGRPLMDLKNGNKVVLHQGADQNCQECPFNEDRTCKETVLVLFTISAPTDEQPAPFGNTLFKMTLPRTARNPFMGDYMLAMEEAYNAVLRYGLDHTHFPQAMIPFTVSLVERSGQYFNEKTQSQTKTSYFVPQLHLDQDRLYARLEKFAAQFGGNVLVGRPKKLEAIGTQEIKQLIASAEAQTSHVAYGEFATDDDIMQMEDEEEPDNQPIIEELQTRQTSPSPEIVSQKTRDLILKIARSHVFTDEEKASAKKTAESQALTRKKADEWIKWLNTESTARKKAEKAKKQATPEPTDEDVHQDREWLVENLPGMTSVAKANNVLAKYDEAVERQDWKGRLTIINEWQANVF